MPKALAKKKRKSAPSAALQLRVLWGDEIAMGPGKAELLQQVHDTGSIAEAARRMGMSYMRAWTLIRTMNQCCREEVLETTRGGQEKGGAQLTPTGRRLLELYRQLESRLHDCTADTRAEIETLFRSA